MSSIHHLSDFVARIRNAIQARHTSVTFQATKLLQGILEILQNKGFILSYHELKEGNKRYFEVQLKYKNGISTIQHLKTVSKPSRRVYSGYQDFKRVFNGYGYLIVSTPQGVMLSTQAKALRLGGEVFLEVF